MVMEPAHLAVGSSDSLNRESYRTKETLDLRHCTKSIRLLVEFVYFVQLPAWVVVL